MAEREHPPAIKITGGSDIRVTGNKTSGKVILEADGVDNLDVRDNNSSYNFSAETKKPWYKDFGIATAAAVVGGVILVLLSWLGLKA